MRGNSKKSTKTKKASPVEYDASPTVPNQVNDISSVYAATNPVYNKPGIWALLGLPKMVAKSLKSDFDLLKLGISGITKNSVNTLATHIGISKKYMAEDIFDVSIKTFERKDDNSLLDKKTSSHAIEIAKVVQHASVVFRDESKLKLWLNRQNQALNNMKPVELFGTLSGLNMVDDILGRIQEGVYS